MSKQLHVELVTPQHQLFSRLANELVCPGTEGSFGVLPGHVPLVSGLQPGMLKIRTDDEEIIYAISGGYAEIGPDKAVILADSAVRAEDIDLEAAKREKEKAVAQLKRGLRGPDLEIAEISLKKALAQMSVAEIVRRKKSNR